MVYTYCATFTKNIMHGLVEGAFPRTPMVAIASKYIGDYAYLYGRTYIPGMVAHLSEVFSVYTLKKPISHGVGDYTAEWISWGIGHFSAPVYAPKIADESSLLLQVAAYTMTSFTLNKISQVFFNTKATPFNTNLMPSPMKDVYIDMNYKNQTAQQPAEQPNPPVLNTPVQPQPYPQSINSPSPHFKTVDISSSESAVEIFYETIPSSSEVSVEIIPPESIVKSTNTDISHASEFIQMEEEILPKEERESDLFDDDPLLNRMCFGCSTPIDILKKVWENVKPDSVALT